ncbi:hypothetical protein [Phaeocystidibacter luteus]|uniref:Outer membrane beta-barrel protein n=1 Tax=Phaeocystidibacter luteus TaxID=911197 RepID=A0A6N6RKS3_9FLAO|nr:hypothetical protein [Phaeocystidibacter luteus]KAB2808703.1 hypothetical protein F8C67_10475 [Phaeocystidibacter luteus]
MKAIALSLAIVACSYAATAQTESNRPTSGDYAIGLSFRPDLLFGGNQGFGPANWFDGLDFRYYGSNVAHQVNANMFIYANGVDDVDFEPTGEYQYSYSNFSVQADARYSFLWMSDIGTNWQVLYGPQIGAGINTQRTTYDYSHSAQEYADANLYGNYFEDPITYNNYQLFLGGYAEIDYFISKSLYVGVSVSIEAAQSFNPGREINYKRFSPGFVEDVESKSPSSYNLQVTGVNAAFVKFGVVL